MTDFGVEVDEMTRSELIADKLDALLAGRETAPGDDLAAELSFMLSQLHQAFPPVVVSEQVEDTHIAKMMEAAASLPVIEAAVTDVLRTSLLDRMRAALSRKVAVASLALTSAFGGAAYAGVLPEPVQREVAGLAAMVGLDLPDGDHEDDTRAPATGEDEGGGGQDGPEQDSPGEIVGEDSRDDDPARGTGDGDDDHDDESGDGDHDGESDDRSGDGGGSDESDETGDRSGSDGESDGESDESDGGESDGGDGEVDDRSGDGGGSDESDSETGDRSGDDGETDGGDGETGEPGSGDGSGEVTDEDGIETSPDMIEIED